MTTNIVALADIPQIAEAEISIASWEPRSIVNGPGERCVIWVQGCPFRCPGCFNQEYLPFENRHTIRVTQLADAILSIDGIEGVTYSGGEPMAQALGLSLLSEQLTAKGLSIVCYTGYTLHELQCKKSERIDAFLRQIDVLIDGRFEVDKQAFLPWRGSSNQVVHFLTERYHHMAAALRQRSKESEIELVVSADGYTATGIISQAILNELDSELHKGIT